MFRKLRKKGIIIPAALHDQLARTCSPVDQVDSEVVRVRSVKRHAAEKQRIAAGNRKGFCYGL